MSCFIGDSTDFLQQARNLSQDLSLHLKSKGIEKIFARGVFDVYDVVDQFANLKGEMPWTLGHQRFKRDYDYYDYEHDDYHHDPYHEEVEVKLFFIFNVSIFQIINT